MKFVLFYHSFTSCWSHGNAHSLRGICRELINREHDVVVYQPEDGWSLASARSAGGETALAEAARLVPGVDLRTYRIGTRNLDVDRALDGADVVIVHEWNEPELVARLAQRRKHGGRFLLFYHDTHHRAITAPLEMEQLDLDGYDGVLAGGEVLREAYIDNGWGRQAFTWHQGADSALFKMDPSAPKEHDLIWIGDWSAGERSEEIAEYLLEPVTQLQIKARAYGVQYPDAAREQLAESGISYAGWLPNHRMPEAFARALFTVLLPRRAYVSALPGVPHVRMFEALSCGIPLLSSPWHDAEGLFPSGSYLSVNNGEEMQAAMSLVLKDEDFAEDMVRSGLHAIRTRHTCGHRVDELLPIIAGARAPASRSKVRRPPVPAEQRISSIGAAAGYATPRI
jgi:spore maturation protein CgeB